MLRGFKEVHKDHKKKDYPTILPKRGSKGSAGYDFYSKETVTIDSGKQHLFWTDVKAYMQEDEVLNVHVRSSIGVKKGLTLANTTGIIDFDFFENKSNDGNIGICLKNTTNRSVQILEDERIAQGIFSKYLVADEDNALHAERSGGFGSSGK